MTTRPLDPLPDDLEALAKTWESKAIWLRVECRDGIGAQARANVYNECADALRAGPGRDARATPGTRPAKCRCDVFEDDDAQAADKACPCCGAPSFEKCRHPSPESAP